MTLWKTTLLGSVAAVGLIASTHQSSAQETITVTFTSGYPPQTTWVAAFDDFAAAVDSALADTGNYAIQWNIGSGGQIAAPRGELEAVQTGIADIGAIVTPFHFDREPVYQLPFVTPFTVNDPGFLSELYSRLEEQFPDYINWEAANIMVLSGTAVVDDYMIISTVPLNSVDDLQGLRIAAAAPSLPWVEPVGAVGIAYTQDQGYTMLDTGVADAVLATAAAIGTQRFCEPATHLLVPNLGANSSVHLGVNVDLFWDNLPEEVQQAFLDAAPVYDEAQRRILADNSAASLELCASEYGMETVTLTPEQTAEWAARLPNIAQDWVDRVTDLGIPGQEILTFYMDQVRESGVTPARDWDRE